LLHAVRIRTSRDPTRLTSPTTAVVKFHPFYRNTTNFRLTLYAPRCPQPHCRLSVRLKAPEAVAVSRRLPWWRSNRSCSLHTKQILGNRVLGIKASLVSAFATPEVSKLLRHALFRLILPSWRYSARRQRICYIDIKPPQMRSIVDSFYQAGPIFTSILSFIP
jgi:hypothetical protein